MKFEPWLAFVLGAGLCWGTYVPLLQQGQLGLKQENGKPSPFAAFLCVGVAYFIIAVLMPLGMILAGNEKPVFRVSGISFGTVAGAAGAFGALCVIFAIKSGGDKRFVAPVIFAMAPVVNTLVSMLWHPAPDAPLNFALPDLVPSWTFFAGIVLAGLGAGLVLYSKEEMEKRHGPKPAAVAAVAAGPSNETPGPGEHSGERR